MIFSQSAYTQTELNTEACYLMNNDMDTPLKQSTKTLIKPRYFTRHQVKLRRIITYPYYSILLIH